MARRINRGSALASLHQLAKAPFWPSPLICNSKFLHRPFQRRFQLELIRKKASHPRPSEKRLGHEGKRGLMKRTTMSEPIMSHGCSLPVQDELVFTDKLLA